MKDQDKVKIKDAKKVLPAGKQQGNSAKPKTGAEIRSNASPVCYADSPELRPEYRP